MELPQQAEQPSYQSTPGPTIQLQGPIGCQVTKLKEKLTTATSSNKKSGTKDYQ